MCAITMLSVRSLGAWCPNVSPATSLAVREFWSVRNVSARPLKTLMKTLQFFENVDSSSAHVALIGAPTANIAISTTDTPHGVLVAYTVVPVDV